MTGIRLVLREKFDCDFVGAFTFSMSAISSVGHLSYNRCDIGVLYLWV